MDYHRNTGPEFVTGLAFAMVLLMVLLMMLGYASV
jgi:tetrahydromethanopterin S-methyltransferase subunit F